MLDFNVGAETADRATRHIEDHPGSLLALGRGTLPDTGTSFDGVPVKLSILMPSYNEERTVLRVTRALLSVDYPCEIELIVVDDGSTDATLELLDELDDPRVVVHVH